MQKSFKITLLIVFFIFIYTIITSFGFIIKYNTLYLYIINPLFWIALAIFLRVALGKQIKNSKNKKAILEYIFIAGLTYIITYMLIGLFVTFGKNPAVTTPKGFFINLWIFGIAIFAREYVRYKLINNVYDKDKVKIAIFISFVYILLDLGLYKFLNTLLTPLFITKLVLQTLIPLIGKNILYSYICMESDCIPCIIYELVINLYIWISPILPKSPWIMTSIIDTVIPVILFLYIRYIKNKKSIFRSKEQLLRTDPRNVIPLVIVVILAIWFAIGIFPVKPVAIATGSMEPVIDVGDIVIIKKCNANDISVNDIIEYQMEGYTVIHRVVEIKQLNGSYIFITKGDNNNAADLNPVKEEQLIGKDIFQIKYLGYPAIWLHIIQKVDVETGN